MRKKLGRRHNSDTTMIGIIFAIAGDNELRARFQGYRQNVQVFRRCIADTRVRVYSMCGLRE